MPFFNSATLTLNLNPVTGPYCCHSKVTSPFCGLHVKGQSRSRSYRWGVPHAAGLTWSISMASFRCSILGRTELVCGPSMHGPQETQLDKASFSQPRQRWAIQVVLMWVLSTRPGLVAKLIYRLGQLGPGLIHRSAVNDCSVASVCL